MIRRHPSRLGAALADESAQVLPWMVLLTALFLGACGLCVDLGHAYVVQRQLQASTDAAALAGGYALAASGATTASVTAAAKSYSSLTGETNAMASLPSVTFSASLNCSSFVTSQNILCSSSSTGDNVIQVTQTSTITTAFIQVLNVFKSKPMTSMTISATSTASMRGAVNSQYNVALVIDTTQSMNDADSDGNCSSSRIVCAQEGAQVLLESLTPCTSSSTSTSCTGFDNVSIFTYPNVTANTAQNDYKCTGSSKSPTIVPYTTPVPGATWSAPNGNNGTYQITGFLDDYSSTNKAGGALDQSSDLSIALGDSGSSKCSGMQAVGGEGTYFAGAIYAALSALNAEQSANPGSLNALIVLSDGDANATSGHLTATNNETLTTSGTYPSLVDQCQQAITAAQSASSTTTVYTIAYGAATGGYKTSQDGCDTDKTGALAGISPCTTLQDMATSSQDFYSDGGNGCSSTNGTLALSTIFKNIATTFTVARLIPNNEFNPSS